MDASGIMHFTHRDAWLMEQRKRRRIETKETQEQGRKINATNGISSSTSNSSSSRHSGRQQNAVDVNNTL